MNFSNDSEAIMTFLMKDFKMFLKKRNAAEQRRFDNIILSFYKKMENADQKVTVLWQSRSIKREIKEIHNLNRYQHDKVVNSSWIPEHIRRFIFDNTKGKIIYRGKIHNKDINITLYLMNNRQFNELGKLDNMVQKMFVWLYFIIPYTNPNCSKYLKVTCYLCPQKKQFPKTQFTVLGPNHVNTGLATPCPLNGDICLYRKEELFKVFLHETFHAFGLDWSNTTSLSLKNKLKNLFPIDSKMEVSETYTEFWANIFNSLFTAFYIRDNRTDKQEFMLYAEYCIHFEQMFSLFQCAKILQFMGIYYSTLYANDDLSIKARKFLYKERSNVFAYYILKMILLVNADEFMLWCKKHNKNILNITKNEKTLTAFFEFIKKKYDSNELLVNLEKMHKMAKAAKKKSPDIIHRTLRMTVIEMV